MRLNRRLAAAGHGSRRACEALILAGRVAVNGRPCRELATVILPSDKVVVDGRVAAVHPHFGILLNKPRGILCTASDPEGRRTVFDLLPSDGPRLFTVGRLDRDSEGLLILTNDGDLSQQLTHPSRKIDKEYEVTLDRTFDPAHAARLLRGFHIMGGRARMERVVKTGPSRLLVVLTQGIKRQIRLMLYDLGYEVKILRRVRIGPLAIGTLRPGRWRPLTLGEWAALKSGESAPRSERSPDSKARRLASGASAKKRA